MSDAVDKYARWMKKYGSQRAQRNTNIDLNNFIFVPHRYTYHFLNIIDI